MTGNPPDVELPMLLTLTKPILADYLFIAHHLPEDQQRQWIALSDGSAFNADQFALSLAVRPGPKWALVEPNGTPVVIGGYDLVSPGVWQDYLIGTVEGWQRHWRSITKHTIRVMDLMLQNEGHRLQCISLADRTMAHKWFQTIGLEYEGTLRGFGTHGEDFMMFAKVKVQTHGR